MGDLRSLVRDILYADPCTCTRASTNHGMVSRFDASVPSGFVFGSENGWVGGGRVRVLGVLRAVRVVWGL